MTRPEAQAKPPSISRAAHRKIVLALGAATPAVVFAASALLLGQWGVALFLVALHVAGMVSGAALQSIETQTAIEQTDDALDLARNAIKQRDEAIARTSGIGLGIEEP